MFTKKYILVLSIMLALMLAIGCTESNTDYEEGNAAPAEEEAVEYQEASAEPAITEQVNPITILDHKLEKEEFIGYSVTGTATSSKDIDYAEIKVKFYDKDGNLVSSSYTNILDLAAGEKWSFKVPGPSSDTTITDYKIAATDTA